MQEIVCRLCGMCGCFFEISVEATYMLKLFISKLNFHYLDGYQGKALLENTCSCRCEGPALLRLLHYKDNGWYIPEHRE